MTRTLLLPSPLLGPASWGAVPGRLADAVVVRPGGAPPAALIEAVCRAAADQPVVLVAHSNTGLYAAHLATLVDVAATVYVDAALPLVSPTPLAPAGLLAVLETLADADGVLPPWTQWWGDDDLDGLFPDAITRAVVEAEQPRLPLDYFRGTLAVPDGWHEAPSAYLAFCETYADELAFARAHDWPTRVVQGNHLHQLHDPAGVAEAIRSLLAAL